LDIHIVVGGQFGSEAKGNFTYNLVKYLIGLDQKPMVIRTGGPNAGHSVVDDFGKTWRLRMVPAGMLARWDVPGAMAEGCEIDVDVLEAEVEELETAGHLIKHRLGVDAQCTLIESYHKIQEQNLIGQIGSTGKGIGAARADRIMRHAPVWDAEGSHSTFFQAAAHLAFEGPVVIEATQGYGLGLHAGYYPQCTSRDVRGIDVLAETGLSPWAECVDRVVTWVVYRPYPIRVAGNSGPLSNETSWEELGLVPEYTTVTKKVRRVGHWNAGLAHDALIANGGPSKNVRPVLMFWDYLVDGVAEYGSWDEVSDHELSILRMYEDDIGDPVMALGVSPSKVIFRGEDF
jgi:adenylosuccinate synthase